MSQHIQWNIEGMTCAGCAKKVTNYLEKQGLKDVYVDLVSGSIDFKLDEQESDKVDVQEGLRQLGYTIVGVHKEGYWSLHNKMIWSAVFTVPLMIMHFVHLYDEMTMYAIAFGMSLIPVIIGFYHFGKSAWAALLHGTIDMDILIFIGGASAFIYSVIGFIVGNPDYNFFETAASIFTIVLFGNWLEHRVLQKTNSFIQKIKDNFPTKATLIQNDKAKEVELSKIGIGDIIRVEQGQHIPLDGKIEFGSLYLDEAMLTGESDAVKKIKGDDVFSGSVVNSGIAEMRVHTLSSRSTMQSILDLVKKAESNKPSLHRLADKVSAIFVPVVLTISILTFIVCYFALNISAPQAIMRSIAVLVISCPCALGLATPAAVAVGVNEALKRGILIKRADIMEVLSKVKYFILDKTGTITQPEVSLEMLNDDPSRVKNVLSTMVLKSTHPLSEQVRILLAADNSISPVKMTSIEEISGKGIQGLDTENNFWKIGSKEFTNVNIDNYRSYVTKNGEIVAGQRSIEIIPDDVLPTIKSLNKQGEVILLSGDKNDKIAHTADALSIDIAYGEVTPSEKLNVIKNYVAKDITAMIGDGINDSAALSAAHVGISMNDSSRLVVDSADVILMGNKFGKVEQLIKISERTLTNIKQNIFWAFAYNIVAIPLAVMGKIDPMWAAIFMASSDVVIILNAIRFKTNKL